MPKRSDVDPEFTRHVCAEIDLYITANGLSDAEAARVLGVRKQMIKPYRRGLSLPGTQAIARACVHWNLRFSYHGVSISASTFVPEPGRRPIAAPRQLDLPLGEPLEFQGVSESVRDLKLALTLRRVS